MSGYNFPMVILDYLLQGDKGRCTSQESGMTSFFISNRLTLSYQAQPF